MLLLYAIGQVYICKTNCFSARTTLKTIVPTNYNASHATPCFALLRHCNSYLDKQIWYILVFDVRGDNSLQKLHPFAGFANEDTKTQAINLTGI